jgi:integrase
MSFRNNDRPITTKLIESLKPENRMYIVTDLQTPNLTVRVHPTGRKVFVWRGRKNGELKVHTLGPFPHFSLAEAREWAREISRGISRGIDVVAERKNKREEEDQLATRTCDWLFNLYMKNEGQDVKSANEKWRLYNREIAPKIGIRSIYEIRHRDLANILQGRLEDAPSVSNHLYALIKRWFKWSVTKGHHLTGLEVDPAANLVKLAKTSSRERVLNNYELGLLLHVLHRWPTRFTNPLLLILHTGVRRGEAFEARWSELDELVEKGDWIIPGARTKNKSLHCVPLPSSMVAMLKATPRHRKQALVWPTSVEVDRPMSGFSKALNAIQQRMNGLAAQEGRLIEHWTIHDLRRSVGTGLTGLRKDGRSLVSSELADRILNHVQSKVRATYLRWDFYEEKKEALRHWEAHLQMLLESTEKRHVEIGLG